MGRLIGDNRLYIWLNGAKVVASTPLTIILYLISLAEGLLEIVSILDLFLLKTSFDLLLLCCDWLRRAIAWLLICIWFVVVMAAHYKVGSVDFATLRRLHQFVSLMPLRSKCRFRIPIWLLCMLSKHGVDCWGDWPLIVTTTLGCINHERHVWTIRMIDWNLRLQIGLLAKCLHLVLRLPCTCCEPTLRGFRNIGLIAWNTV